MRLVPLALSRSQTTHRSFLKAQSSRLHATSQTPAGNGHISASDKLFADAAREESEANERERQRALSRISALETQDEHWTGDEKMEHAVLRMLVDKYKPLRTGEVRTADQKLKQMPPRIVDLVNSVSAVDLDPLHNSPRPVETTTTALPPGAKDWKNVPLITPIPGHKPWHTEFRAPSHATSSVKYAMIPPYRAPPKLPVDDKAKRKEVAEKKRLQHTGRITRAKESSLDYRLGIRGAVGKGPAVNPVSMRGWTSMIEDKIERAKLEGLFNNVKGRGKPLERHIEETNPFIAREEFLMNRIVQRHGASPPWVDLQTELNQAVKTFRDVIRQSWTRRAIRTITSSNPVEFLPSFTLHQLQTLRDAEWEKKERAYHDTAVREVNAIVQRYNGLAPYSVRRQYYVREKEVQAVYADCAEEILGRLRERAREAGVVRPALRRSSGFADEEDGGGAGGQLGGSSAAWDNGASMRPLGLWDVWKGLIRDIQSMFRRRS